MMMSAAELPDILNHSPVRVLFGPGRLAELGECARSESGTHVLLVTDPGIIAAEHADRALDSLREAGLAVTLFDGVREDPTTEHVAAGLTMAAENCIDFIVGLGGGSAMDCAKGINLLLTNGGQIADYWGVNKTTEPMLPMIAVPTTAGTGSEAQSFALISDPVTHRKMACGDRRSPTDGGLRPRVAILDADLTLSQPPPVAAAAGIDAVAHAVETAATTERSETSRMFSRLAWRLLTPAYPIIMRDPADARARADMLLGAHLAGAAIENSMLGAAHACANPLTARCGITHGCAVGLMLPHVVRFNSRGGNNAYAEITDDPEELVRTLDSLLDAGGLPRRLRDCDVPASILPDLARLAAEQWTARFNPERMDPAGFADVYRAAH